MKKYLFLILIALFFVGCKANTDLPEQAITENKDSSGETTRDSESQKQYPKLKVENKKEGGQFIFLVELPNYRIEPLEIRSGESMTFELNQGLYCYENVTVHINYGASRSYHNDIYFRKNFADGQTTTITLQ